MSNNQPLREHVLYLLKEGGAHAGFDAATKGLYPRLCAASGPREPRIRHGNFWSTCVWRSGTF